MEKNYSEFREISIYDTGLVRPSSYVAGIFKKNNIESLEDLFRLDDELGINYGANTYSATYGTCKYVRSQIHGIIKLLRYKYLNEDLFADTLYDNNYNLKSEYFEYSYIYPHIISLCIKNRQCNALTISPFNISPVRMA